MKQLKFVVLEMSTSELCWSFSTHIRRELFRKITTLKLLESKNNFDAPR